jgi:hypothetical protein
MEEARKLKKVEVGLQVDKTGTLATTGSSY